MTALLLRHIVKLKLVERVFEDMPQGLDTPPCLIHPSKKGGRVRGTPAVGSCVDVHIFNFPITTASTMYGKALCGVVCPLH